MTMVRSIVVVVAVVDRYAEVPVIIVDVVEMAVKLDLKTKTTNASSMRSHTQSIVGPFERR